MQGRLRHDAFLAYVGEMFIRPYLRTSGRYTNVRLAAGNGDWMGDDFVRFGVLGSSRSSSAAHPGAPPAFTPLLKRN